MANAARGEAEIEIAGKRYPVCMNMGALAGLASALGVETFPELQNRLTAFKLPDMPIVVRELLRANGHDVPEADIAGMDPMAYFESVIPAIFRRKDEAPAEGNPPKSRAKK